MLGGRLGDEIFYGRLRGPGSVRRNSDPEHAWQGPTPFYIESEVEKPSLGRWVVRVTRVTCAQTLHFGLVIATDPCNIDEVLRICDVECICFIGMSNAYLKRHRESD